MVIVMDMSSGQKVDDFGLYEDEVLLSNWMPQPELGLQLQGAVPARPAETSHEDVEGFLRRVYLAQE